ncbi:MAG TPA: HEAT repeat domain-containing protein [Pseudomonadota bacterium]|nr:HEAT repeat domain-containing protein [Pseudomonadota bacterium]
MSLKATAMGQQCPRCGALYDQGTQHQCGDGQQVPISVGNEPVAADPLIGTIIGERYDILSRLSAGGMGVVYKARHVLLDNLVAVKVLLKPQDLDAQRRFLQEAQLACKIQHPNIVYISDFGVLPDGRSYIVMELLRGQTIADVINKGRVAPIRVCQIGVQIARGLQAVHDKGIIHRDLKPENIFLIEQDGKKDFVKIVDFGIATDAALPQINVRQEGIDPNSPEALRAVRQRQTLPGTVLGTPHYMSPEQALGEDVDHRADQYALGCILYEMLAGTVPFDDDNPAALMFKHAYRPPPSLLEKVPGLEVSASLMQIVMRTLIKSRDQRFPAMRDLEAALQAEVDAVLGKADSLRSSQLYAQTPPVKKISWLALVGIALTIAVVIAGGTTLAMQRGWLAPFRLDTKAMLALRGAALAQLKEDLRNPDPELRRGAIGALGATADGSLAPLLAVLLEDKETGVQIRAAEMLGQLGQPGVVPKLVPLLERSKSEAVVAVAAAEAMDQLGDARGQQALRQAMSGKQDMARLQAAMYLCGKGEREAQKMLTSAVSRGKVPEEIAVAILSRLAQSGDTAARENLLLRLNNTTNRDQQLTLASTLARIGEGRGRELLRDTARKPGPQQLRAATLLAGLDEPTDAELFRGVVNNGDAPAPARILALGGLAHVGATSDLKQLQGLLKQNSDPKLRQAAAAAMLRISDADPVLAAAQSMPVESDPSWLLRDNAVAALGDLDSQGSVNALARVLRRRDSSQEARLEAARVLGRRSDPAALRVLRDSVEDGDAGVRQEVIQSLASVGRRLGERGLTTARMEATGLLNKILLAGNGTDEVAARAALLSLGDESQRAPLSTALKSLDERKRLQVVQAVERDSTLLAAALDDKAPVVRQVAARKLAAMGDQRAAPALRETVSSQRNSADGLHAYAQLRRLGQDMSPPPDAQAMLDSKDAPTRAAALEALSVQGGEARKRAMEQAVRDSDPRVRQRVLELALEISQEKGGAGVAFATSLLKQLSRDSDGTVRARATALLTRLQAQKRVEEQNPPTTPATEATGTGGGTANPPPVDAGVASSSGGETPTATAQTSDSDSGKSASEGDKVDNEQLQNMLKTGREQFKRQEYRKAQKSLERLSSLCGRQSSKPCAPISYELAFFLGRSYEEQGQQADAMNEFQRLSGKKGGTSEQRDYISRAIKDLGRKLGRVQVKRSKRGRCETTILWVTPGEQVIPLGAGDTRTVTVGRNEKVSVGECK